MNSSYAVKPLAKKRRAIPYVLFFFAMMLTITFGCFMQEQIAFFNENWSAWMSDTEFYLTFVAFLLQAVIYLFLAHRYYKIGIHWGFLLLFGIMFACNVVSVILAPSVKSVLNHADPDKTITVFVEYSSANKIRYSVLFFAGCLVFYLYFAVFPKTMSSGKGVNFMFYLMLAIGVLAIVFSLIREWNQYEIYFKEDGSVTRQILSFFNNSNTFATYLLFGICAAGYLNDQKRNPLFYVFMLAFYIELLFTFSKTSLFYATLYIVTYLLYRFFLSLKSHPIRNTIALIITLAFLLTMWYILENKKIGEEHALVKLYNNLKTAILSIDGGSIRSRAVIWNHAVELLTSPTDWIFGLSETQFYFILGATDNVGGNGLGYAHNGFVHLLGSGGIIRVVLYAVVLIVFFWCFFDNLIKKRNHTAASSLLFFVIFLVHGLDETTAFLIPDAKGCTGLLMVFLPVLCDYFQGRHPEGRQFSLETARAYKKTSIRYELSPIKSAILCFAILTPIVVLLFGSGYNTGRYFKIEILQKPWFYILIGVAYLQTPFCVYHLNFIQNKVGKAFAFILLVVIDALLIAMAFIVGPIGFADFGIALVLVSMAADLGFLIFCFFCSIAGRKRKKGHLFIRAYVPNILIALFSISLCHLTHFIPNDQLSRYETILCVPIIAFMLILLFYVASPLDEKLVYPLPYVWGHFEEKLTFMREKLHGKWELSMNRYLMKRSSDGTIDRIKSSLRR